MYTKTPDIRPFTTFPKFGLLSQSELDTLKEHTLHLIEEVGVYFPSEKALNIFAENGATVDFEKEIVRISPDMVHKAMSHAPRSFVLGGREERFDMVLDGTCSYLSTDGTGVHVIDPETREKRESRKEDVELMARVCDALPLVSFFWPMVSSKTYGPSAPLHNCHAGLTNTLKHVRGATTMLPEFAHLTVEMATAVAGSKENVRKRPPINANICTISPLGHDKHGIESALIYAEAGIPISFMAMPTMGSTAPASPQGALVMGDAEVISAMVLMQLAHPGAPVFHAIFTSLMDPRTGGYISEVPTPSYRMAMELAHAWNVPSIGGGRLSGDALELSWQSGYEVGMGAVMAAIGGSEICGILGLIGSATTLYPEEIILDHDACLHVMELMHKFQPDDIDSALDVIKEVGPGPGGHFLAKKHTKEHIRDFQISSVLRGKNSDGKPGDSREIAYEKFKQIEATHKPEPLSDEVLKEFDKILAVAECEAEKVK